MKSMSLKRLGSFSRKLTAAALLYSAWTTVVPGLAHGEEVIAVFDPVDSTDEIKAAIRSAGVGGTVIIPNVGETWFVSDTGGFNAAIALNKDNMTLVLEEGVRIQALTNAEFFATQSRRLIVVPANGCRIIGEGSGATVAMNRDLYIANDIPDDDIELGFRHAVRVGGVDGFEIRNLTIEGSGGDGIQLGDFYTGLEPSDILIQDVNVVDATRNGMALTSGSNVLVDGCMVTGTSGAFPRAGIDVEVDKGKPASVIEGMRIENTIVMDNEGSGFQVGLFNYYTTEGEPVADVDLHIRNCTSIGNGDFGVRLTATRSGFELGGPGGEIVLEDVLVSESEENGTRISGFVPGISPRIQFRGVVWDNVATSDPLLSPILFRGIRPGFPIGGVDFLSSSTGRCRIIDPNFERAALEQDEDIYDRPNSRRGIEDIQGEIEFVSASDQFLDFGPEEQAIDIGVQRVFGATNLVGFQDGKRCLDQCSSLGRLKFGSYHT